MPKPSEEYKYWVKLATWAPIIVVSILIITKAYAWVLTGSASLLATLTDSILDIAASLINFFVVRYSLSPADDEHRFGHGKAESLAGLAQAAFICGSSMLLIFHSAEQLINPNHVTNLGIGYGVTLLAIGLTTGLVFFQQWIINKTQSTAIKADALHYRGDILMNVAVLVALYLSGFGYLYVDSVLAILIALFLIYSAWEVLVESAQHLMDRELPEDEQKKIYSLVLEQQGVHGAHAFRTRQSGQVKFVQFHIELDDSLTLYEAHDIADKVEKSIKLAFDNIDVLIHQDPLSVVGKEI